MLCAHVCFPRWQCPCAGSASATVESPRAMLWLVGLMSTTPSRWCVVVNVLIAAIIRVVSIRVAELSAAGMCMFVLVESRL